MRAILSGYFFVILSLVALCAQDDSALKLMMQGDSLRRAYRFEEAIGVYKQAMMASSNATLLNESQLNMILCENGLNMLRYVVEIKVLGVAKIPKESFYLYLNNDPFNFWAFPPSERFPEISQEYPAFVSLSNKMILFTGKSMSSNNLDIYFSQKINDTLWSYPILMESTINSTGNECYPVLSADGKTLWFASDGHYGMGGFDLYVSHLDEESGTWSQAINMGFPYSSPEDDLTFMASPDGQSAFIISDRGEDKTHLYLYKVEHELNPKRHDWRYQSDISSLSLLRNIAQNDPATAVDDIDAAMIESDHDYVKLVQSALQIKEEVVNMEKKLVASREMYARLSQEEDRLAIAKRIEEEEMALIDLNEKYRLVGIAVQKVEMEFLQEGGVRNVESVLKYKEQSSTPFIPQLGKLGNMEKFLFATPIIKKDPIDISFRIDKQTQLIIEEELPTFFFYRIQLSNVSAPANADTFKGISPVFETKLSGGKYLYAAGLFNSYAEASVALQKVQSSGFKTAFIIAYNQGNTITVANARKLEPTVPKVTYRLSLGSYPQGLPQTLSNAIKDLSNKDLARVMSDEGLKYVVGAFSTLSEAQTLKTALIELGFQGIFVEPIHP